MKLYKYQKKVVGKIILSNEKRILVSMPTGSGKSIIISDYISSLDLEKNIILVGVMSSGSIHKQLLQKINNYPKQKNKAVIMNQTNIASSRNKIFVFGFASFGKGKKLTRDHILEKFLKNAEKLNKNVIFIKDESHFGLLSDKSVISTIEKMIDRQAKKIINFSATPSKKRKSDLIINVNENDIIKEYKKILKSEKINNKITPHIKKYDKYIEHVFNEFIKSKKDYDKYAINPLLFIQVESDNSYKHKKDLNDIRNELQVIINKCNELNLKILIDFPSNKYENYKKPNKESISKINSNDSDIDVIVFKTKYSTGVDIPRANTILMLRNIKSKTLYNQTIGRLMRYPIKDNHHRYDKNLSKYFIYDNYLDSTAESIIRENHLPKSIENRKILIDFLNDYKDVKNKKISTTKEFVEENLFLYRYFNFYRQHVSSRANVKNYINMKNNKFNNAIFNALFNELIEKKSRSTTLRNFSKKIEEICIKIKLLGQKSKLFENKIDFTKQKNSPDYYSEVEKILSTLSRFKEEDSIKIINKVKELDKNTLIINPIPKIRGNFKAINFSYYVLNLVFNLKLDLLILDNNILDKKPLNTLAKVLFNAPIYQRNSREEINIAKINEPMLRINKLIIYFLKKCQLKIEELKIILLRIQNYLDSKKWENINKIYKYIPITNHQIVDNINYYKNKEQITIVDISFSKSKFKRSEICNLLTKSRILEDNLSIRASRVEIFNVLYNQSFIWEINTDNFKILDLAEIKKERVIYSNLYDALKDFGLFSKDFILLEEEEHHEF